MSNYNLKNNMGNWGPFEEKEAQWLIFTVGNPYEGHGLALPKSIDDFHAKKVAYEIELRTGQRYVAHVPYTTDRCGPVAKDWAPYFIPWEEFYEKTVNFMNYYINLFRERGDSISNVMLIIGHGGNAGISERKIQREITSLLQINKFIAITALVTRKEAVKVINGLKPIVNKIIANNEIYYGYDDPDNLIDFFTKVLLSSGHASHTEHSLGAALGMCDYNKLEIMNLLLEKDFEKALKKWPPIGGLGGYLLAGGKYTEALGTQDNDKYGLWNCLNGLKTLNHGKLFVEPELGKLIYRISVESKINLIQK